MSKTVLITGASAGIGAHASIALAQRGLRICLMARRKDRLEAIAETINSQSVQTDRAIAFVGDVAKEEDRQKVFELVMDRWGRLDVLINNAGYALAGALEDVSLEEVRSQFEVNTFAPLAMMQLAGPIMRSQRAGRILNVSSISGVMSLPGVGIYAASKFAIEALSDAARREYHPFGIKVCVIQPGGIRTEIWDRSKANLQKRSQLRTGTPFRKFYDKQLEQLDELLHDGYPTQIVTDAICHAATSARPKARYCMPQICRNRKIAAALPTRIQDWLVRRYVAVEVPLGERRTNYELRGRSL